MSLAYLVGVSFVSTLESVLVVVTGVPEATGNLRECPFSTQRGLGNKLGKLRLFRWRVRY